MPLSHEGWLHGIYPLSLERVNVQPNAIHPLVIVGSGPAGYTAGIYAARAGLRPLLLSGTMIGGQLTTTHQIANWPGGKATLTGPALMDQMKEQVESLGIPIRYEEVLAASTIEDRFSIQTGSAIYLAQSLVVATGSSPRYLGIPSEKLWIGKGISTCATCDGFFYKDQTVAVVGGGNTAVQEALYLSSIAKYVLLIHRSTSFRAEVTLLQELHRRVAAGKIVLLQPAIVTEFLGELEQGLQALRIENTGHHTVEEHAVKACFLAIGHLPNSQPFRPLVECDSQGYIQVGRIPGAKTSTSCTGIFAAGDVADPYYQQAITAAAMGCMAAIDAQHFLSKSGC